MAARRPHERFSRVGPFILMDTLGVGSFGKVKLCAHARTLDVFACKVLEKTIVRERVLNLQVQKEIDIMRSLRHPNCVSLFNVLSTSSKVFIVMELVTGGELFDEIVRHRRLSEPYARFYFQQLIDGVEHCHEHGVYHRDLKPENLLLDHSRTLKITDFGLSTLKAAATTEGADTLTSSLMLHTQCGTPNYVAPEIITMDADGYSGARVDAWSCGIILYVLVAGALPFDANEMDVLFRLILRGDLTYPPFFSDSLIDLVSNLLRTKPDERYTLSDVKRHPWFNGPVVNSMPNDPKAPPPLPCMMPFATPPSSTPPSSIPSPVSPRSISPERPTRQHESNQTSLLAQYSLKSTAIEGGDYIETTRGKDSLDVDIRSVYVDCELPVPPDLERNLQLIRQRVLFNCSRYEFSDSRNLSMRTDAFLAEERCPDPVSRFKTRVLGGTDEAYVPSSDDDHYSEFEEAREMHAPDEFFGGKAVGANLNKVILTENGMRRVQSDGNLQPSAKREISNGILPSAQRPDPVDDTMHGRVRRHLWENAAETWRISPHSCHVIPTTAVNRAGGENDSDFEKVKSLFNDLKPNSGDAYVPKIPVSKPRSAGAELASSKASVSEFSSVSKDNCCAEPAGKIEGGKIVRSCSHDGYLTTSMTRRRPRSKQTPDVTALAKEGSSGCRSQTGHATPNGSTSDKNGQRRIEKQRNGKRGDAERRGPRSRRRGRGNVRIRDDDVESCVHVSSFRPEKDWVQSTTDRRAWFLMMKDFEMIPDDLEFGMDSASLNEKWQKALEDEGLMRKGSFAAYRFGSSTYTPSRSTQYLSSPAHRSEAERWLASRRQPDNSAHELVVNESPPPMSYLTPPGRDASPARRSSRPQRQTSGSESSPSHRMSEKPKSSPKSGEGKPTVPPAVMENLANGEMRLPQSGPYSDDVEHGVIVTSSTVSNGSQGIDPYSSSPMSSGVVLMEESPAKASEVRRVVHEDTEDFVSVPARSIEERGAASEVRFIDSSIATSSGAEADSSGIYPPEGIHSRNVFASRERYSSASTAVPQNAKSSIDAMMTLGTEDILVSGRPDDKIELNSNYSTQTPAFPAEPVVVARALENASRFLGEPRGMGNGTSGELGTTGYGFEFHPGHEGRTRTSNRGTDSRGESGSSAGMRSGGSDGLTSTPRDPDREYTGHPNDEKLSAAYVSMFSSGDGFDGSGDNGSRSGSVSRGDESVGLSDALSRGSSSRSGGAAGSGYRAEGGSSSSSHGAVTHRPTPLSPFAVDIPGPRRNLPRSTPLLGSLFPSSMSPRRMLKKNSPHLRTKSGTQFNSLMEPSECFDVIQEILEEKGCSSVKGSKVRANEKYKIKCELKQDEVTGGATILVHKLDEGLCAVLFKKKPSSDARVYHDLYEDVYSRYCEKSRGMARAGEGQENGSRRRSKRTARVRFDSPASSGTEPQILTPGSPRSGNGGVFPTESIDSDIRSVEGGHETEGQTEETGQTGQTGRTGQIGQASVSES